MDIKTLYIKLKPEYKRKYSVNPLPFNDFIMWAHHRKIDPFEPLVDYFHKVSEDWIEYHDSGYFETEEFKASAYGQSNTMLLLMVKCGTHYEKK